jgi:hypothetical protein
MSERKDSKPATSTWKKLWEQTITMPQHTSGFAGPDQRFNVTVNLTKRERDFLMNLLYPKMVAEGGLVVVPYEEYVKSKGAGAGK